MIDIQFETIYNKTPGEGDEQVCTVSGYNVHVFGTASQLWDNTLTRMFQDKIEAEHYMDGLKSLVQEGGNDRLKKIRKALGL